MTTAAEQDIQARVAGIFELIAGIPAADVQPEKNLALDLKIDSLTMIELAVTIQDELSVSVEDDKLKELKTVGDIIDLVRTSGQA